ncbi:MAG: imidazoleglycerol-phosphate dehydratase HisB [Proteobacteria bacterium]|nr:imidazoleglycerol-phosphate dehydratase HisB [Pseudomonadota bacterium]
MTSRTAAVERKTKETEIELTLNLDGSGQAEISTGIGFLDHLLTSLTRHSQFDLKLKCQGDLDVDDHHTAEDSALALGSALDTALGDRCGITRFGSAYAPLDEALARAVVDFSGRPFAVVDLGLGLEKLGELSSENASHVIQSLATASRAAIHVDVLRGENDHHRAEAAFKALALALKQAVTRSGSKDVPSTKGVL